MQDKSDHSGAMLEIINDQLSAIREGQVAMSSVPGDIATLKQDVSELKNDVKAIKTAVSDHSRIINRHEVRITELGQAA
jgi:hypothetical protein